MNWRDKYGFLHLYPDPDPLDSENGPLITGENIVLDDMNGELTELKSRQFFNSISQLRVKRGFFWGWQVTPESDRFDFSKDNWYGVWMAVLAIRNRFPHLYEESKHLIKKMPLFHKQLLHPITFMIIARCKYGIKLFDPIIKLDFLRTAKETHKIRGKRVIAKTDNKIMGMLLIYAFKWDEFAHKFHDKCLITIREYPLPVNNKNVLKIEHGWTWQNYTNMFKDYFIHQHHPNTFKMAKYEENHG
jgi:hypothetical protein